MKQLPEGATTTIVYLLLCVLIVVFLYKSDKFIYQDLDFVKIVMIPFIIAIVITFMLFFSSALMAILNIKPNDIHNSKILKFSSGALSFFTIIYVGYAFFNVLSNFNKAFVLPENIENTHNLLETMREEDSTYTYQIAYINDLYVFVNVNYKKDNQLRGIKVIKADSFFEAKNFRVPGEFPNLKPEFDSLREAWKKQDSIYDKRIKESIKRTDSMKELILEYRR